MKIKENGKPIKSDEKPIEKMKMAELLEDCNVLGKLIRSIDQTLAMHGEVMEWTDVEIEEMLTLQNIAHLRYNIVQQEIQNRHGKKLEKAGSKKG